MPLGVSEEHEALRRTVRRWVEAYCPPEVSRLALEAPAGELPGVWKEMAAQGWLGLHVAERHGGEGFSLLELAVVLEELGRACVPGPVLPTVVLAAVVARWGTEDQRAALLPGLVDGSQPGAVQLGRGAFRPAEPARAGPRGGAPRALSGSVRPILGLPTARWALVAVEGDGGAGASAAGAFAASKPAASAEPSWWVLDLGAPEGAAPEVRELEAFDPSRPLGALEAGTGTPASGHQLTGLTRDAFGEICATLAAAESAGGAAWCLESAAAYAQERVQFGRPIGQFQAVKHRLADMLVAVEQAAATAWDAAGALSAVGGGPGHHPAGDTSAAAFDAPGEASLSATVAAAVALEAFARCAKDCVQLHGGIGFTWEHDAHRYLKRAIATRGLLGGATEHEAEVAELALAGARRTLEADLPGEAQELRNRLRPLLDEAAALDDEAQRPFLVEHGLVAPHWPAPWGRDATALEQIVIDEEMAARRVQRPQLGVGAWALPTLVTHGTEEQQERWVRPTLRGELAWCQLFSEPGAGSDLASLSTRAERVEGGWVLTGQKVWTSLAQAADFGICLARSDPSVPKHAGITYFVLDMRGEGIDIRPLRELTGAAMFNEVFLERAFVPDDAVVGAPGDGWRIARTTLANERVSMSSGSTFGTGVESLLKALRARREDTAAGATSIAVAGATLPEATQGVGHLLAEAHSLRLLGHRSTLRTLAGADPGPGASVRKLLGAEHEQRVQEYGLVLSGPEAAVLEGRTGRWGGGFLATRCLTIAGGTSEVQRNVIAERLLGQPKDPEPGS